MAKIVAVAGVDEMRPSIPTLAAWGLVALTVGLIFVGTLRPRKAR